MATIHLYLFSNELLISATRSSPPSSSILPTGRIISPLPAFAVPTMKIDSIPGVSVSLVSNDATLKELQCCTRTLSSSVPGVVGYVEATAGATFAIQYAFEPTFPYAGQTVAITVRIDGTDICKKMCSVDARWHSGGYIEGVKQIRNGKPVSRRFQFAQLQTSMHV